MRFRAVNLDRVPGIALDVEEHALTSGDEPTGNVERFDLIVRHREWCDGFGGRLPADVVMIRNLGHHDVRRCRSTRSSAGGWGHFRHHRLDAVPMQPHPRSQS